MLFSSLLFLYYFLPITIVLYFIVPFALKNIVLLTASLIFYGWGEPRYVILMILSIVVNYIFGLLIDRFRESQFKKYLFILCVIFNLGMIGYFKYANFFLDTINNVLKTSIPLLKIALPIGISFYTFQILSYVIDVYREDVPVQKNIIHLATYITLFPQLVAGPIVRYSDVNNQLGSRKHSLEYMSDGIKRFVIGLSKKIFIANQLGEFCNQFLASSQQSSLYFWIYGVAFMLHIYFDFSGYSDMAIGMGKMFGFDFLENFNYPYISMSITEFWRRWHMSLGTWFREYVYIPLGGNRVSHVRHWVNIFVVWLLTGFWHGADWNFIIWGLMYGILLILEKEFLLGFLKKHKVFSHIYVLFTVMIGFVIFNSTDLGEIVKLLGCGFNFSHFMSHECLFMIRNYLLIFIIGIIGATPLPKIIYNKMNKHHLVSKIFVVLEPVMLVLLMLFVTAYLVDGSFNPFLYFRF